MTSANLESAMSVVLPCLLLKLIPTIRTRRRITLFIFETSLAYSWSNSCSMGVNCGGGEFAREVEWDRVEVIVQVEDVCRQEDQRRRVITGILRHVNDLPISIATEKSSLNPCLESRLATRRES
jgi:hypothetical protein